MHDFDLPHVVANLPDSKNLKFVGGDMFQYISPADAILFKVCGITSQFHLNLIVYLMVSTLFFRFNNVQSI